LHDLEGPRPRCVAACPIRSAISYPER